MVRPSNKTKMHVVDREIREKLGERIKHAMVQHPEGPSLEALQSELAEAYEAMRIENKVDYLYELYDVATVAIRLIEQEENHRKKAGSS